MGQLFIDEIQAIVVNNISNEKFDVSELASQLGLSNSQTLRKVKAATGKSVNQYIREFRLEEAAKLIKTTDDSISEISYKVGFGSPSYFNKAFSKYFGVAPGEYKNQGDIAIETPNEAINKKTQSSILKKAILYAISAIFTAIVGYVLVNDYMSKDITLQNSIAVLPFKDLSPEDNQWFCDGVSDNILHSLAQMKDLSVISFTSSSTYRNTDKQVSEIAKELGVSYILEGSVVLYEGKIKIIAQLIDANDKHVWSKEYNENFDNVIAIQNSVAQEVMQQLKITLNTDEENALKKYPTKNMEAYNFHLKGRLVNESRVKKDLEFNIEMNKKAIVLDSNFSQAYAEVAKSYYLLSQYHFNTVDIFDCRKNATIYTNKALQADTTNALAWAIKAGLSQYKDWDQAKVYNDKAIALNPNNPFFRTHCAIYYEFGPKVNIKKSLEEYRIAYKLDPLSKVASDNLFMLLIFNNHLKEADEHLEKIKFLFNKEAIYYFKKTIVAFKNKDWTMVLRQSKSLIEAHPNNAIYYNRLAMEYNEILNDNISAINYAKKAYELDSTRVVLYVNLLVEGDQFEKAHTILQSRTYKSVVSKREQLYQLWNYYYHQENYTSALDVLKDSLFTNNYYRHTYTYAKMGNRKKVDSMNKRYPWGTGRIIDWRRHRASIHAALKDRDSMYYYLEQMGEQVLLLNSYREVDPYRNEERFKAFLRKNYLPVPVE